MFKRFFIASVALIGVACAGAEKSVEIASTPIVEGEVVELVAVPQVGGASINESLWARKSSRDFTQEPLSLEELSGVIWAAAGVNRVENQHLTAPSALALYPIRTYAFLEGGVYLYDAANHKLNRVVEGEYRELSAMQDFAYTAQLNIVYVADKSVYDGRGIDAAHVDMLCGLDAAGYAENVNLYSAGHNLKAITRGSYKAQQILELLSLDSERYSVALAQTVGK